MANSKNEGQGTAFLLMKTTDRLPEYITEKIVQIKLPDMPVIPPPSEWTTLYFPYGRRKNQQS